MKWVINILKIWTGKLGLLNSWNMVVTSRGHWTTKLTSGQHNLQDMVHRFLQTLLSFQRSSHEGCIISYFLVWVLIQWNTPSSLCVLAYWGNISSKTLLLLKLRVWKMWEAGGQLTCQAFWIKSSFSFLTTFCSLFSVLPHRPAFFMASSSPLVCLFQFTFNSFFLLRFSLLHCVYFLTRAASQPLNGLI